MSWINSAWVVVLIRLNRFSVNAFVGTGLDYDINKKININATLSFRGVLFSDSDYRFRAFEGKAGVVYYFNYKNLD